MKTTSVRRLDGQGRVILPAHIRKALNLEPDSAVTINLRSDGAVIIRPAEEICCICGKIVDHTPHVNIVAGQGITKHVCEKCTELIKEVDGCTRSLQKAMKSGS